MNLRSLLDRPLPEHHRNRLALGCVILLIVVAGVLGAIGHGRRGETPRPADPGAGRLPARPVSTSPTPVGTVTPTVTPVPVPALRPGAPRTARAFLNRWIAWSYGLGRLGPHVPATAALLRSLRAHPPRGAPHVRRSQLRWSIVEVHSSGPGVAVATVFVRSPRNYTIVITLSATSGRWLVSAVE